MEIKFTAKMPMIVKYKTLKDKFLLFVSLCFYFPIWVWITLWTPLLKSAEFDYKFKWSK